MGRERLLPELSALLSAGLAIALGFAAFRAQSQLGLAQAADSLLDVGAAILLAWSARVAREPRDDNHQLGHTRAEALGALAVATLALLLGFEVIQQALWALLAGAAPETGDLMPIVVVKVMLKLGIFWAARGGKSPALGALRVDARNDILVGMLSLTGLAVTHFGYAGVDAWFAIPLGAYIVRSGVGLAAENTALLMGEAPSKARQQELHALVRDALPKQARLLEMRAQHLGPEIAVEVEIELPEDCLLGDATRVTERVRAELEREVDVLHAAVVLRARKEPISS